MGKNKLDAVNFCKLFDMFGEDAAKETLADVNAGKISLWSVCKRGHRASGWYNRSSV